MRKESGKAKNIGKILWESLERWVEHLFPLVWVSIAINGIMILVYFLLWHYFTVQPIDTTNMLQSYYILLMGTALPVVVLVTATALLDVVFWGYCSGSSLRQLVMEQRNQTLHQFFRLLGLDIIFITALVMMGGLLLLMFNVLQQSSVMVLLLLVMLIIGILFILLIVFALPFYRFLLRPVYTLQKMDIKQAWKTSRYHFQKNGLRIIGTFLLTYLIVILLTPRTSIPWINQIPSVVLAPYVAIVIWTLYHDILFCEKTRLEENQS